MNPLKSLRRIDSNLIRKCVDAFPFPPVGTADETGLLAYGGDLSVERLVSAYAQGIFPWYNEEPILWYSPDPRMVLYPGEIHISRSLRASLRKKTYSFHINKDFDSVISHCSSTRRDTGTWLNEEMIAAYIELNRIGIAISAETWQEGELTGGVYGLLLGNVFFGESMFFKTPDASKIAFVSMVSQLNEAGVQLIDCQVETDNLRRFGARLISRRHFQNHLQEWVFI